MSTHSIDADIKVKWAEGQSAYSPFDLDVGIDLLVRDRGAEAARGFIDQVVERYAPRLATSNAPAAR